MVMDADQIYAELVDLADKLGIRVSERVLSAAAGIKAKSGLCKVKGQWLFVMDKRARIDEKVRLLARCLAQQPVEDIYLVPAVRAVLGRHREGASGAPN
jgi:hypothetical protein